MRLLGTVALVLAVVASASADPAPPRPTASVSFAVPALNTAPGASSSLDRMARALERARRNDSRSALARLEFAVQVFGAIPRPALLEGFDVSPLAPVPFGPPTHQEWLRTVTPAAFQSTLSFRPLRPGGGW
jgi:hypothetical protein